MIDKFVKIYEELKDRMLMNKLDSYANLISYYLDEATKALDNNDQVMYAYWSTKASNCMEEYSNGLDEFRHRVI